MRRFVVLLAALLALAAPAQAAKKPPVSWAQAQIEAVVGAGLMAPRVAEFRPGDPLTRGELDELLTLLGKPPAVPAADASQPVKLRELDAALVRALGLTKAAKRFRSALVAAGLNPPAYAGVEIVARLLGLRTNHPQADDPIEVGPASTVNRAEAAYSVARWLDASWTGLDDVVAGQASSFALPALTEWQARVLDRAVRFVGYPYIWGGSSERTQRPFGVKVPGGFDCSGFVWRVYKLEPFEGAPALADTLQGRTTYEMSREVVKALRIPFDQIQPGDVLFFGERGPKSKPGQIGHMGIALGGGWMIHSSSRGTTVASLEGWYTERFAWARRPLAEAGLE
jgi:cell wall-associated NlpC family hydrolase